MKRIAICLLSSYLSLCCHANGQNGILTTVAGNGDAFLLDDGIGDGGPATEASLFSPGGIAVDALGNLFIADSGHSRVRKVSASGLITTVAGNGDFGFSGDGGPATSASLSGPGRIAVDTSGNLFIVDGNTRIRKVSASGLITTVAGNGNQGFSGDGGPATSASLSIPKGIAVDSAGNLFIADCGNNRIRRVSVTGVITTVAGTAGNFSGNFGDGGPATSALLDLPNGVAVDVSGNLFIADYGFGRIRKVSTGGIITTYALGPPYTIANPEMPPWSVAVDMSGNLFIAAGSVVRKVSSSGVVTTVAGNGTVGFSGDGGPAISAAFRAIVDVVMDALGNLYILDQGNNRIRKVSASVSTTLPPPSITSRGIVPVGSPVNTIQPGEWVSIYGSNLAPSTATWNGNFPISLDGTSVTINGKAAYLWFVSPNQINLQAPTDTATGPVSVVVTTAGGVNSSTVTLAQFAPSFSLLDNRHVAGIILRSDGTGAYGGGAYDTIGPTGNSLGYPTVAAKAGDIIELFAYGFGPTNPAVQAGQAFSGAALTTNPVNLLINNVNVSPSFAGLSSAGLYQINFKVTAGLGTGDVPLVAIVGGVQTQSGVVISLQ
jgi:uncharacterized protein (TIGR03437 family)